MVAAVLAIALLLVPPVYLFIRAGFGDAWAILGEPSTRRALYRTIRLAVGVGATSLVIGGSLAWLVARTDIPLRRLWAVLAVVPLAMPSFVAALALAGSTGASGLLSRMLGLVGLGPIARMEGYWGAMLAVTMATYPYVYLLTLAALKRLDPAPEEAARSLGRGPIGAFAAASLPQLRRALAGGALLAALYALSDFGAVSLMRYTTITRAIFQRFDAGRDRAATAVLGILLIALTVALLVIETFGRGHRRIRTGPGARREPARIPLGRARPWATAWAALICTAFVILPVIVMFDWIRRGAAYGRLRGIPWEATYTSLWLALVAAVVATVLAMPVSLLATRHPRPWTQALERTGYGANALPGVVIGLALVFLGARYLPGLYQTFTMLLAAYVIRFFAEALAGVDTALNAVNPRAEEAARSLGRRPSRAFLEVSLPAMRPGLVAAVMLVFLSVIKELPATALLLPTGARTLATEVWTQTSVGAYGAASVAALVLMVICAPFIVVAVHEHVSDGGTPRRSRRIVRRSDVASNDAAGDSAASTR